MIRWLERWWYRRHPLPFALIGCYYNDPNSPWGMLDREDAWRLITSAGFDLSQVKSFRPILLPVDLYARPWTPE